LEFFANEKFFSLFVSLLFISTSGISQTKQPQHPFPHRDDWSSLHAGVYGDKVVSDPDFLMIKLLKDSLSPMPSRLPFLLSNLGRDRCALVDTHHSKMGMAENLLRPNFQCAFLPMFRILEKSGYVQASNPKGGTGRS